MRFARITTKDRPLAYTRDVLRIMANDSETE